MEAPIQNPWRKAITEEGPEGPAQSLKSYFINVAPERVSPERDTEGAVGGSVYC